MSLKPSDGGCEAQCEDGPGVREETPQSAASAAAEAPTPLLPVSMDGLPVPQPGMDVMALWSTFQQWCTAQKLPTQPGEGPGEAPGGGSDPNILSLLAQGLLDPTAGQPAVRVSPGDLPPPGDHTANYTTLPYSGAVTTTTVAAPVAMETEHKPQLYTAEVKNETNVNYTVQLPPMESSIETTNVMDTTDQKQALGAPLETYTTITIPEGEASDAKPVQLDIIVKDDTTAATGVPQNVEYAISIADNKPEDKVELTHAQYAMVVNGLGVPGQTEVKHPGVKSDVIPVSTHASTAEVKTDGTTTWVVVSSGHVALTGEGEGGAPGGVGVVGGEGEGPRPTLLGWTVPISVEEVVTGGDVITPAAPIATPTGGGAPYQLVQTVVCPPGAQEPGTTPLDQPLVVIPPDQSVVMDTTPATPGLLQTQLQSLQPVPLGSPATQPTAQPTAQPVTMTTTKPSPSRAVVTSSSPAAPRKSSSSGSRKRKCSVDDGHGGVLYTCKSCGTNFNSSSSLGGHRVWCLKKQDRKRESPTPQWRCEICARTFKKQCNFLAHEKHCTKVFRCLICRWFFPNKEGLTDHACAGTDQSALYPADTSGDEKNLTVCDKCGLCMYNHLHVTQHRNQHEAQSEGQGTKQFSCSECDVYFVKWASASQHLELCHSGSSKDVIRRRTGSGGKPFVRPAAVAPPGGDKGTKRASPVTGWLGTQKKNIRDMLNMVKEAQEPTTAQQQVNNQQVNNQQVNNQQVNNQQVNNQQVNNQQVNNQQVNNQQVNNQQVNNQQTVSTEPAVNGHVTAAVETVAMDTSVTSEVKQTQEAARPAKKKKGGKKKAAKATPAGNTSKVTTDVTTDVSAGVEFTQQAAPPAQAPAVVMVTSQQPDHQDTTTAAISAQPQQPNDVTSLNTTQNDVIQPDVTMVDDVMEQAEFAEMTEEEQNKYAKQFRCGKCKAIFSKQREWAWHEGQCKKLVDIRKTDEFTKYGCEACGLRFGLMGLLIHHLHVVHSLAWNTAKSVASLADGQVRDIPPPDKVVPEEQPRVEGKRYRCKVCKKRLHSWNRYQEHKKEHANLMTSGVTAGITSGAPHAPGADESSQASVSTHASDRTSDAGDSQEPEMEDAEVRTNAGDVTQTS